MLAHLRKDSAPVMNYGDKGFRITGKYDKYSAERRKASADILNGHLLMTEIMMANMMQYWIMKACGMMEEYGISARFNIKQKTNELRRVSADLMKRCNEHDRIQVKTFASKIYPSLVDNYISDGGTVTQNLQASFMREYQQDIDIIYFSTKNIADKQNIRYSDVIASLEMVLLMALSGIDFYNYICKKVDSLLFGIGSVKRIKSRHNEQILSAARSLIRSLGYGGTEVSGNEAESVRKAADKFKASLSGEGNIDLVEHGIIAMQINFIEYVIASLRVRMETGGLEADDFRTLILRLGSKQSVRRFFQELSALPLPDKDEDIFDYMDRLPGSEEESMITCFRRLSINEENLGIKEEDTELRMMRRFVYRHADGLDLTYMRYLYWKFRTKKSVLEYLSTDREVFARTIRHLRRMRCRELAVSPASGYRIAIGETVRKMREERHISGEKMAKAMGSRKQEEIWELENIDDVSSVPPEVLADMLGMVSSFFGVIPQYLIFRSLRETGKDDGSYQRIVRHLNAVTDSRYGRAL